jgi:hypothetical protein
MLIFSVFRFTEKGNLEVLLFTIQSKMRANNQKVYMPREGKLISDINKVKLMCPVLFWPRPPCRLQALCRHVLFLFCFVFVFEV